MYFSSPFFLISANLGKLLNVLQPKPDDGGDGDDGAAAANGTADSLCDAITPIDKANADKPGTEYETEIGDDCKYLHLQ